MTVEQSAQQREYRTGIQRRRREKLRRALMNTPSTNILTPTLTRETEELASQLQSSPSLEEVSEQQQQGNNQRTESPEILPTSQRNTSSSNNRQ